MKKLAIGVLSAGALAVAGGLGTSYYMGGRIQQALEDTAQLWSTEDGFSVRVLDYERGLIQSQATTLWSFATEEDTYDLTVTHDIVHGPWPMGKAAKVVSRFVLPEDSEAALVQALQGRPPLEWSTTASWSGETAHTLFSPNFNTAFDDGSTLGWGGLKAQWVLSAERNAAKGFVQMPVLRVKVEEGISMDMEDTEVTFDANLPATLSFWNGPSSLKVGLLQVHDAEADTHSKWQGIDIQATSSLQDNMLQIGLQSSVSKVEMPDFSLNHIVLEAHAKRIDAAWFNDFLQWMQQNAEEEGSSPALLSSLPELLVGKPEIAVTRLAMDTPEGSAEMSTRIAYVGQSPEAFNPIADLHVQVHAQLPKAIMAQLLGSKVRSDYLELLEQLEQEFDEQALQAAVDDGVGKRLKGLLELGAIKDGGSSFSADMELNQGELTLNGQPNELRNLLQMGGAI